MDMITTPTPGLYRDMPPDVYHATRALSASGLKLLRQSPAHYYGKTLDPCRPADDPSPAMRNGTLVHTALFERDQVSARYAVKPEGVDFRAKEGKAWREAHADREIVEASAMTTALAQAAAVRAVPELSALLADGYGEASAFWHDRETGVLCKCRPDWVSPAGDGVILVDGKTCRDASPEGFGRAIWNLGYYLQAAWYVDGFERATGLKVHGFVFAAVESEWPHAAAAYMLGDDVLDRSRIECRRLTNTYAECLRSGQWPGYADGIQLIYLPKWAHFTEDNE